MIPAIVVVSAVGYLLVGVCVSAAVSAIFEWGKPGIGYTDAFDLWFPAIVTLFLWPIALACGLVALVWLCIQPLWFAVARRLNPDYAAKMTGKQ